MRRLNNADVLRGVIAAGLCVAIQVAAVCAPLVHAHLGGHESADHHATQTVHAHLSGHSSSHHSQGRSLDDSDAERTVFLQLFVAVSAPSFHLPPALVSSFDLTAPAAVAPRDLLQVVHGHDPPFDRSRPSRAPPSSLS